MTDIENVVIGEIVEPDGSITPIYGPQLDGVPATLDRYKDSEYFKIIRVED